METKERIFFHSSRQTMLIMKKYERWSGWYDWTQILDELLFTQRLRKQLIPLARDNVLEIGVGTGKNFPYYPRDCEIAALDISPKMIGVAKCKARKLGMTINFLEGDAEILPVAAGRFETVISTMNLCTFINPIRALQEMARCCTETGVILLLEHGRSSNQHLAAWQEKHLEKHAKALGCYWNREPGELVRQAGLRITRIERHYFGLYSLIEAKKA